MKRKVCLNRSGFTLVEVIVVAAIIAILAGILVPMIFNQIDEAKITKAKGDVASIQKAITAFKGDTKSWPSMRPAGGACTNDMDMMYGAGALPGYQSEAGTFDTVAPNQAPMVDVLGQPASGSLISGCVSNYKGPYVVDVGADPWDKAYIVYTAGFRNNDGVWVISGGPNKYIETDLTNVNVAGDDIAVRLK